MAKISDKPITSEDISEYLNQKDDFDLEMRTLKASTSLGLECRHGGTYIGIWGTDHAFHEDITLINVVCHPKH